MKKDYEARIKAMKARRQNDGKNVSLEKMLKESSADYINQQVLRSYATEDYERRGKTSALKYALGAMQEVDPQYTNVSLGEAGRVSRQVEEGLDRTYGKTVETKLQGSLPINVHLRRSSDVDILVFPSNFLVYSPAGILASTYSPSNLNKVNVTIELRRQCAQHLTNAYPSATVDDSGSKCITITGGSLRRDVDVVPALWYDTAAYQSSKNIKDRAVEVLDKKKCEFNDNMPFLVQYNINNKDELTFGGCKKAIRLLKTLRADADDEIDFSSFNIMSIIYNMDNGELRHQRLYEGALIVSINNWLNYLGANLQVLRSLDAVDGSRKVIQSSKDEAEFQLLRSELNDLVEQISVEIAPEVGQLLREPVLRNYAFY
ncbi:hypothetical protein [Comamonas testosteroni]|uniref:hypothetical protein n=1 Tax=Comamonas testosteroni TaxID=285 RepID=UPI000AE51112|nr:hypothetical protein [Comamonas testosteroni]